RDIVESRWLQEEKASLKELAEKYGVSLERIRQIESKAFKTMQPFLDRNSLEANADSGCELAA
ncbi:MAG: sigma factor-like helix-turn-helix DNA-binding protein, partial [Proteobacteria bacterium]|nr:sigma factor-like helix-turn-helix DNA-binding protein [Pseudomonadota bacterium]